MSTIGERLHEVEARAPLRLPADELVRLGVALERRRTRRVAIRRAGVAAAVIAVGVVAAGAWSVVHRSDPVAPVPSPSATLGPVPSLEPSPAPIVSPSPEPAPDIAYSVSNGVTTSAYLPVATPATPEVWATVGSGWALVAYEGGLLESGRVTGDGVVVADDLSLTAGNGVSGPRVLYLVSPRGEVYEVANLTDAGAGNVLAWDASRGVALLVTPLSTEDRPEALFLRTLDLESGIFGPWFEWTSEAWEEPSATPVDGNWLIDARLVDDAGTRMPTGPALTTSSADAFDWVDGDLVQWYLYPGVSMSGTSLYVSDGWSFPLVEVPAPADSTGNAPGWCRASRLASPAGVAYECIATGVEGGYDTTLTSLSVYTGGETMDALVPWDRAAANRAFRSFDVGCVVDGVAYGDRTLTPDGGPDLPPAVDEGLWARGPGYESRLPEPPGGFALRCEGTAGARLVVAGVGGVWLYDPGTGAWERLLASPAAPPGRDVAGPTDLGVVVAP